MRCSLSLSHIHTYRNLFVTVCSFFCLPRAQPPRQLRRVDDGKKKVHSSIFLPSPCLLQMEEVIARMQDEKNGIPIRTVKSFLTKIPSVFSGKASVAALLLSPSSVLADSFLWNGARTCMACSTPAPPAAAVICISICGCLCEKNLAWSKGWSSQLCISTL